MEKNSLKWSPIYHFAFLVMLSSAGCSAAVTADEPSTPVLISTPEKLQLIGGEINPCLVVNVEEVEFVLGVEVSSEAKLLDYKPGCKYISPALDPGVLLMVSVVTDVSIEKANQPWLKDGDAPISAVKVYEREKMGASSISEFNQFRELDDLGDKAFRHETTFLVISFLKNNIYYQFYGRADYGVDFDTLMKLIRIGFERMP